MKLKEIAKQAVKKAKGNKTLLEAEEAMAFEENEKGGAEAAKKYYEESEKINEESAKRIEGLLKESQKDKETYKKTLGEVLYSRLCYVDWPIGFKWRVLVTKKGVAVAFTDWDRKVYAKGIKETGMVTYDFAAIDTLAKEAENSIAHIINGENKADTGTSGGGGDFTQIGSKPVPRRPV